MKKLTSSQILKLNANSEIDNNKYINETLGLETKFNFDIWKDGCYLIECKLDIRHRTNGFAKAKKELDFYSEKLKLYGLMLPKLKLVLDYETMVLYNDKQKKYCDLKDFDFDVSPNYENYDITYENGPNVAQQIYSRHPKINDGNIFNYFRTGIDWYNPSTLTQKDFRLVLDLFNDPTTQRKRGAFYTPDIYIYHVGI